MIYCVTTGRLGRDPERKDVNGKALVKFSVASDRFAGQGEKATDWLNCTAWESRGEFVSKHFHKGDWILVHGNLKSHKDGDKTYWELDVQKAEFCGGKVGENRTEASAPPPSSAYDDDTSLPFDL